MHLSRLYISGFRSIKELNLRFTPGKNVIIGRNNAGKSNIVRALDLVLGESAPAYARSENVTESDFYCSRLEDGNGGVELKSTDTIFIWCELDREIAEGLNWLEINKCFGFSYHGDKKTREAYRLKIENLADAADTIFRLGEDEAGYEKVYVDSKLANQASFKNTLDPMLSFAYAFRAKMTEKGIVKEIRFLFRESDDEDWVLAFRSSVRTELLQSAILPAFRDPASQLRSTPWTWFGKLMRHLTSGCKDDHDLVKALQDVQLAGDKLFEGVTAQLENDALSVSFPDARLSFQFHGAAESDLYKNCSIYVDDGFKSPLTDKGAGIQSATIIGLFSFYTSTVNTLASALLCVEEPELYLHPHARRVVSDRLDDFLDTNRNQVIVTTHGVEFLRTSSETFNLILVQRSVKGGTTAQELDAKEFLGLLIDNNQNELFFADKVILCEGHDEHLIRAIASEFFPGQLDRQNISVISVGGKDQITMMAKVILSVGIKCYILADFDFLLRDTTKPADFASSPHKSVEHLPDLFFAQEHMVTNKITKGRLAKCRNVLREAQRKEFFLGKHCSEFDTQPKLAPFLKTLRLAGLGLLEGELEHLSKDQDWVSPTKKFTLERAYELRETLSSGGKASDAFECSQICELLNAVISA